MRNILIYNKNLVSKHDKRIEKKKILGCHTCQFFWIFSENFSKHCLLDQPGGEGGVDVVDINQNKL